MTAVIYEANGTVQALALPLQRARVVVTPAQYIDRAISAVIEQRTIPAVMGTDEAGEPIEITPARTVDVEVSPARTLRELVAEAVYRDETPAEMLARMIADELLPDLPWARHVIVAAHPAGRHGEHWTVDWVTGTVTVVAAPVPPPPDEISDRQFFQGLAMHGLITETEALAAVATGTIPAAMAAFIGQLPADQQFAARMILCGATVFSLKHPLTQAFATMSGMDAAALDAFWRFCAEL